jgi:hypothetical protein
MLRREYMIKGFPGPASIKPVINCHKICLKLSETGIPKKRCAAARLRPGKMQKYIRERNIKHEGNYGG